MRNHALSEQHEAAMSSLLKKAEAKSRNQPLESYCHIALMFMTEELPIQETSNRKSFCSTLQA